MSYAPTVKREQSTTSKKTHFNNNQPANKSSNNNNNSQQPDTLHYQTPISNIQDIRNSIGSVSSTNSLVQAKLRISQPGDVYEQEADRVAEKAMSMPSISFSYPAIRPIRKTTEGNGIDKKCAACETKGQLESIEISRKPSHSSNLEASDQVTSEINTVLPGTGSPLDANTKEFMESRFVGYDLSNVRIHTDAVAARSAESVNALAYTVGNDITFGEEQYSPNTTAGKRLLAHELTHVIQQNGSGREMKDLQDSQQMPIDQMKFGSASGTPFIQRQPKRTSQKSQLSTARPPAVSITGDKSWHLRFDKLAFRHEVAQWLFKAGKEPSGFSITEYPQNGEYYSLEWDVSWADLTGEYPTEFLSRLDDLFQKAVKAGDWKSASSYLGQFSEPDMAMRISRLTPEARFQIKVATPTEFKNLLLIVLIGTYRTKPLPVNLDIRYEGDKRIDDRVIIDKPKVPVGDLNIGFTGSMAVKGKAVLTDVLLPKKEAAAFVKQRVSEQFKSAFGQAKVEGTSSKVELELAGKILVLELAPGAELQPAFQVSGHVPAEGQTLKVQGAEVTNAALTLDITAWISPAKPAANATVGTRPPPPSDASVVKFSFAGQDVQFEEKSEKKRTGSVGLKSDMDDFETRVPEFVKNHPFLKLPEQRMAFFQEMRTYFGTDKKTVDHFAKFKELKEPDLKGKTTILHEEAAKRLMAVKTEIGKENMPYSGGVGWPRSQSTMGGEQTIGNLHNIGFAIDYNAYQAPHIKDQRIMDLIKIVTNRPASLHYNTPAKLDTGADFDTRAIGETFTRGSEADKAKLMADKKVQTWLDQVEKEAAEVGKASDAFRASLKTKNAAGAEVDWAPRLQELRTKWFSEAKTEADQKKIQDELQVVLKPWIEKVAAQKTAMEAKIAAVGLDPAKLPTGAKLEAAIKLPQQIKALTGKPGRKLKKGERAQVDLLMGQAKELLEDTAAPPADDAAAIIELKRLGDLVAQREATLVQKKWLDRIVRLQESLTGDPKLVFGTKFRDVSTPGLGLAQLVDTGYFNLKGQAKAGKEAFGTDFVKSMVKHGFTHGGTWSKIQQGRKGPDFMHFELRWE